MAPRLIIKQLKTRHIGPCELELEAGECVTLSGASGSGKTLLLRALADLDLHQGEVFLDGEPCSDMKGHQWRRRVGLLPAESQWWGERIGEHFARPDEMLLGELGFGPEVMEWEVARCSTGERQRLALARLLQNEPRVLLLDEPTASLDGDSVVRVEGVIAQRLEQGCAVLWVTHDEAQARRVAARRLRIVDGQLEEPG